MPANIVYGLELIDIDQQFIIYRGEDKPIAVHDTFIDFAKKDVSQH